MPVAPCFDPTTGASGGATGGATPPTLSVSGRTNRSAYTVSSGARSLTISNPDAASLLTTVKLSTDGSAVTVTDPTSTSPSWTAAAGGASGLAYEVTVTATKGGAVSQVSFTEAVDSTAFVDVSPIAVNLTDGTWTLYDPLSLVKSITYDAPTQVHTVTMNALAAPTSSQNPCGGTYYNGPRWYKALSVQGTNITADKIVSLMMTATPTVSTAGWNQRNIWGTTCAPTSEIGGSAGLCGIGIVWQAPAGTEQGVYRLISAYTQSSALSVSQWGQVSRGKNNILGTVNTSFKSNGEVSTVAGNVLEQVIPAAQNDSQVYLYCGLGIKTNSSTIPQDAQTQFKLGYQPMTITGV